VELSIDHGGKMSVASVVKTSTDQEYCAGSGRKAYRKGSKFIRGKLKYKCSECGQHFGSDANGNLNKHGYQLGAIKITDDTTSMCGGCGKKFKGLDYLCEKCRAKAGA
jgi:hypothetical protein